MSDLRMSITRWAVPDDGWLRIDVRIEPLRVSESFYRVQEDGKQSQYSKEPPPKVWVWRKWVSRYASPILDALESAAEGMRLALDDIDMPGPNATKCARGHLRPALASRTTVDTEGTT